MMYQNIFVSDHPPVQLIKVVSSLTNKYQALLWNLLPAVRLHFWLTRTLTIVSVHSSKLAVDMFTLQI